MVRVICSSARTGTASAHTEITGAENTICTWRFQLPPHQLFHVLSNICPEMKCRDATSDSFMQIKVLYKKKNTVLCLALSNVPGQAENFAF